MCARTQKKSKPAHEDSVLTVVRQFFAQCGPLCRDVNLRDLLLLKVAYWASLAGGQSGGVGGGTAGAVICVYD